MVVNGDVSDALVARQCPPISPNHQLPDSRLGLCLFSSFSLDSRHSNKQYDRETGFCWPSQSWDTHKRRHEINMVTTYAGSWSNGGDGVAGNSMMQQREGDGGRARITQSTAVRTTSSQTIPRPRHYPPPPKRCQPPRSGTLRQMGQALAFLNPFRRYLDAPRLRAK
jgi:hypothetical protein